MATEVKKLHVRERQSSLADAEKRTLVWIARRLPRWVNSDHLTLLGLISMILAGISYWAARWNDWTLRKMGTLPHFRLSV